MPACSLIKLPPHQMQLQSNQFYELHLYLATRHFLPRGGCAKGPLLAQKRCGSGRPLAGKNRGQHQLGSLPGSQMLLCVCVFAHIAAGALLLLQLPVSVTAREYVCCCYCFFFFLFFFLTCACFFFVFFLQVMFCSIRGGFSSSWHNLFNLTCQMECFPNFAIW